MIKDKNKIYEIIKKQKELDLLYVTKRLTVFPKSYLEKYPFLAQGKGKAVFNNAAKENKKNQTGSDKRTVVSVLGWFTAADCEVVYDEAVLVFFNSPTIKNGFKNQAHIKGLFRLTLKDGVRINFFKRIKELLKVPLTNKEFQDNMDLAKSIIDQCRPVH